MTIVPWKRPAILPVTPQEALTTAGFDVKRTYDQDWGWKVGADTGYSDLIGLYREYTFEGVYGIAIGNDSEIDHVNIYLNTDFDPNNPNTAVNRTPEGDWIRVGRNRPWFGPLPQNKFILFSDHGFRTTLPIDGSPGETDGIHKIGGRLALDWYLGGLPPALPSQRDPLRYTMSSGAVGSDTAYRRVITTGRTYFEFSAVITKTAGAALAAINVYGCSEMRDISPGGGTIHRQTRVLLHNQSSASSFNVNIEGSCPFDAIEVEFSVANPDSADWAARLVAYDY